MSVLPGSTGLTHGRHRSLSSGTWKSTFFLTGRGASCHDVCGQQQKSRIKQNADMPTLQTRLRSNRALSMLYSTSCRPSEQPVCASRVRSLLLLLLPVLQQLTQTFFEHDPFSHSAFPAVIYIKHRVNRAWYRAEQHNGEFLIGEDEKICIRDRLVPILAASDAAVRQQLVPVIQRVLQHDFPSRWPRFMDYTTELLHTNNPSSVLAGLQCLLAICRSFRYKSHENADRAQFDIIVENSFPRLLTICNELVNQESEEAAEMLHLALKSYKHATWVS